LQTNALPATSFAGLLMNGSLAGCVTHGHAHATGLPTSHVAPNCMHDGSAGLLGRILHRHALALVQPLRSPLYRHLRIDNARCVQPLEASDDARPLPPRGRATLRHGGRTARALLEVPHAATRDACAAELPAVLWLTLGLLAADGMALQARRPPCAPDAGDPSGAVGSGRRRKLAHVSAFGAVPICRPGRCSERKSWSSGATQRGENPARHAGEAGAYGAAAQARPRRGRLVLLPARGRRHHAAAGPRCGRRGDGP